MKRRGVLRECSAARPRVARQQLRDTADKESRRRSRRDGRASAQPLNEVLLQYVAFVVVNAPRMKEGVSRTTPDGHHTPETVSGRPSARVTGGLETSRSAGPVDLWRSEAPGVASLLGILEVLLQTEERATASPLPVGSRIGARVFRHRSPSGPKPSSVAR